MHESFIDAVHLNSEWTSVCMGIFLFIYFFNNLCVCVFAFKGRVDVLDRQPKQQSDQQRSRRLTGEVNPSVNSHRNENEL